jgi:hypothetical protein
VGPPPCKGGTIGPRDHPCVTSSMRGKGTMTTGEGFTDVITS